MPVIKPYTKNGNEMWFRIPQRRRAPDLDAQYFGRTGEFSPHSDKAFTNHIKRLNHLKNLPHYINLNGTKIKAIRDQENFWY